MRFVDDMSQKLRAPSNSIVDSLIKEQSALNQRLREVNEELRHKKIQCDHLFILERYEPNNHWKHHSRCYYRCSKCFETEMKEGYLPAYHR